MPPSPISNLIRPDITVSQRTRSRGCYPKFNPRRSVGSLASTPCTISLEIAYVPTAPVRSLPVTHMEGSIPARMMRSIVRLTTQPTAHDNPPDDDQPPVVVVRFSQSSSSSSSFISNLYQEANPEKC